VSWVDDSDLQLFLKECRLAGFPVETDACSCHQYLHPSYPYAICTHIEL
jgi:hypothetical protein